MDKMMEITANFVIPRMHLEGELACEMRFGRFRVKKWKFHVNLDPNFLGRAVYFLFSVNLEGFFTMVGEIPGFVPEKKRKEKSGSGMQILVYFHTFCKKWKLSTFLKQKR